MHEKEVCERVSQHFQYLEDYQFSQVLLYNYYFLLGCFEAMELFKLLQCNIFVFVSAG